LFFLSDTTLNVGWGGGVITYLPVLKSTKLLKVAFFILYNRGFEAMTGLEA